MGKPPQRWVKGSMVFTLGCMNEEGSSKPIFSKNREKVSSSAPERQFKNVAPLSEIAASIGKSSLNSFVFLKICHPNHRVDSCAHHPKSRTLPFNHQEHLGNVWNPNKGDKKWDEPASVSNNSIESSC